jgi:hypothetical protein
LHSPISLCCSAPTPRVIHTMRHDERVDAFERETGLVEAELESLLARLHGVPGDLELLASLSLARVIGIEVRPMLRRRHVPVTDEHSGRAVGEDVARHGVADRSEDPPPTCTLSEYTITARRRPSVCNELPALGTLRARATPIHVGRSTQQWGATVHNLAAATEDRLVATGRVRLLSTTKT